MCQIELPGYSKVGEAFNCESGSGRTVGPAIAEMAHQMKVIVVGGGIGGLSLALSLHQAGIAVRVYEAASDFSPARRGH